MRDLMFQAWPDGNHRWHWVVFKIDPMDARESKRDFESREQAEWDARRFIERRP